MLSSVIGKSTSLVEINNISKFGIWLLANGKEYFLPYDDYPWFKSATVEDILDVQLLHKNHLHWSALDVDLELVVQFLQFILYD